MIIIPAIDLIDGCCVRLTRGKFDSKKKYSEDPVRVARKWRKEGAEWLHLIDLDGARTGKLKNVKIISEIKKRINIKIQYGGGVRDSAAIEKVLKEGADRIILGTAVIENKNFLDRSITGYRERVVLSLDYGRDGIIFKNGWQKDAGIKIFEIIKEAEDLGAEEVIVTDISRDGTLEGINIDFLKKILKSSRLKFIIAGGIGSIDDIINLKKIGSTGIMGVIVGKALYEGKDKINLKKAIRIGMGNDN
ncbi:MAG: 1-(5-phosphoribosyl)-5-[(5-phosphoribosylamino)methylideneamino]imidazole-4-carboxamide isomerase [Actinomycetota bacterium]|nr:1-(5-phosphoribosyl)-5-[(5-phosphoribosylamino)methylideneamino]imidazole-4-carboxamide isomerase [Actinomycetota bacterium]